MTIMTTAYVVQESTSHGWCDVAVRGFLTSAREVAEEIIEIQRNAQSIMGHPIVHPDLRIVKRELVESIVEEF